MSTDKNADYKLEQREFRALVKRKVIVPKGFHKNMKDFTIPPEANQVPKEKLTK